MTVVGETPSGWWAACGHPGCYWIVTGRASERSAVRQRDLHLAWEHYGFGCTAQPVDVRRPACRHRRGGADDLAPHLAATLREKGWTMLAFGLFIAAVVVAAVAAAMNRSPAFAAAALFLAGYAAQAAP